MARVRQVFRSLGVRLFLGVLVAVGGGLMLMANVDARSVNDRAKDWVAANQTTLPQALEEYAAYPIEYQRAIYDASSPQDKSRLWRTQLGAVLAREQHLTIAQRALLQQGIDLATPESFEPTATPPDLCPRIAEIFPDARERRLFMRLGSAVEPSFTWRPTAISLMERVRARLVVHAAPVDCNCRGLGLCECNLFEACDVAPPNCIQTHSCGCIWLGECDKTCVSGLPMSVISPKDGTKK